MNNDKAQEFVITVWREESNQVEGESNQVGNQVEPKSNEVEEKSNQVEDHNTGLRHSDTDHDTRLRCHPGGTGALWHQSQGLLSFLYRHQKTQKP